MIGDLDDTNALQEYWEQHRISESDDQHTESGSARSKSDGGRKRRTLSDAAGLTSSNTALSKDHPAISLAHDLEVLGPLLFPLQRAALLRKRILIMTSAPVRSACDLVYNLSVISNIPPSVSDLARRTSSLPPLRPLFNVGVHDIAHLSRSASASRGKHSWIACTTDDILGTKPDLYDVLVELPTQGSTTSVTKQWPRISTSGGEAVKATQRDLRRYYTLRRELERMQHASRRYHDDEDGSAIGEDESDTAPLTSSKGDGTDDGDQYIQLEGESTLAEPASWASIAYSSFLWWASSGEKDAVLEDEACQDARLLDDLPLPEQREHRPKSRGKHAYVDGEEDSADEHLQSTAVLLIAYAQRLTTLTMETLAEVTGSAEGEGADNSNQHPITIHSEDVRRMGLDEWSQSDGDFIKEMASLYFGHEHVQTVGRTVDLCGIKIC